MKHVFQFWRILCDELSLFTFIRWHINIAWHSHLIKYSAIRITFQRFNCFSERIPPDLILTYVLALGDQLDTEGNEQILLLKMMKEKPRV